MIIDGKNKTSNSIIIPIPPTANAGYPINLFLAISDMPPSPAPIMRSIVTNSYIPINFEIAEISTKTCSYLLFSICALYFRFDNEPSIVLSPCRMSILDLYLIKL